MPNIYNRLLVVILLLTFLSCIEENVSVESTENFNTSALLLREFEERGDFINSIEFPALISADSVYMELNNYFVIDVRASEDYINGHIPNSVNISNNNLYDYITNLDSKEKNILLVSNTGQASAYYLTLLRYAGLKNVYSLKFGIAVWNKHFEHIWKDNMNNYITDINSRYTSEHDFNNIAQYFKPSSNKLPILPLSKNNLSVEEIAEERIKAVMNLGYDEKSFGNISTENTMGIEYITSRDYKNSNEFFIVCYGNEALYFRPNTSRGCLLECSSHPWGTYLYNAFPPYSDLKTSTDLQSMPNNKPIIIYSFTGERSAMAVAYLKLLGYDAKSIIFGGQYMFHSRFVSTNFLSSELLAGFGIQEDSFKDYPFTN